MAWARRTAYREPAGVLVTADGLVPTLAADLVVADSLTTTLTRRA